MRNAGEEFAVRETMFLDMRSRLSNRRRVRSGSLKMTSVFLKWPAGFGGNAGSDLYLRFALIQSKESGASYFAQAYIPTQPAQAIEGTRISQAHEDPGRQESYFPPSRQGAQAGLGETRFPRIVQWRGHNAAPVRCCASPIVANLLRSSPGNSDLEK
jgi:hypothetical protein